MQNTAIRTKLIRNAIVNLGDSNTLDFVYAILEGMCPADIKRANRVLFEAFNTILGRYGRKGAGFTPDGYSIELREILANQIEILKFFSYGSSCVTVAVDSRVREILGF